MRLDLERRELQFDSLDGQVDPRRHREAVVRRLLGRGVSEPTLLALLPEWEPLIRTAVVHPGEGGQAAVPD